MWSSGDWSHGWGATPLIQMTEHILGVAPATPGYATVSPAPNPLDLSFAQGVVPTPHGDIAVSWKRSPSQFLCQVTLPAGTVGQIDLSGAGPSSNAKIEVDGRPAGAALPLLTPGTHTIRYAIH